MAFLFLCFFLFVSNWSAESINLPQLDRSHRAPRHNSFYKGVEMNVEEQVYIVYMGELPNGGVPAESIHLSMLETVLGSSASNSLVRSYKRSFNGFAAKFTEKERKIVESRMEGVVSVFPSRKYQLHTTGSWDFMGFTRNVTRMSSSENDLIIGVIDSGIWPESESFSDEGFGPPPKKWKGICQSSANFSCNNKLIGARSYLEDSPRDMDGHGTHTASTAAGREVEDVSFFGLASGTARGAVPSARIAAYQVCGASGCSADGILAAFDDAIADGVDVISVSLGHSYVLAYLDDAVAIGSFHGMAKGILTCQSAGNEGPFPGRITSVAPWLASVAASTTDRSFFDTLRLGNGKVFVGVGINTFNMNETDYSLVDGLNATVICNDGSSDFPCLDEKVVKGKIVFCGDLYDDISALQAGAAGAILADDSASISFGDVYALPASLVVSEAGNEIKLYMNKTKDPRAKIYKSETIVSPSAPRAASFSSRGPNLITSDILKPDLSAPGVNIIAAFSLAAPIKYGDNRFVKYTIESGTSMSCPHVSGAAAYVKTFHPDWSSSAIKSALMTTALPMNASRDDDEFAYGAGHINPVKAVDPGLLYDANIEDYIQMLCNQGYDGKTISLISGKNQSCSDAPVGTVRDLNYPSMAFQVEVGTPFQANFSRTVTNVGSPASTYNPIVKPDNSPIKVTVSPDVLQFSSIGEKKSFVVSVFGQGLDGEGSIISFSLVWSDGNHTVRSPIIVYTKYNE